MDRLTNNLTKIVLFFSFMALISGCAGTSVSKFTFSNDLYKVNIPIKEDGCYDASVLLGVDVKRAKDIANKVIVALDATVEEETDTSIKAQRNRHIGVFVGSGGEELAVTLREVDSSKTFVTATTKTGFVGGAGQKAWSCEIIDKIVGMASK